MRMTKMYNHADQDDSQMLVKTGSNQNYLALLAQPLRENIWLSLLKLNV